MAEKRLRTRDFTGGHTSKCLIIEKFNDEDYGIQTILKSENGDSNNIKAEIEKKFTFRSFEEFEGMFSPYIYEYAVEEDGKIELVYSLKKPGIECNTLNLKDNPFYQAVFKVYSQKGKSGNDNDKFDYSVFENLISPKSKIEEIKEVKKGLLYNFNKYEELNSSSPESPELEKYAGNIKAYRLKIINMISKSPIDVMPLMIEEKKKQLMLVGGAEENNSEAGEKPQIKAGSLFLDEAGELRVEEKEPGVSMAPTIPGARVELLAGAIAKDFDNYANDGIKNDSAKSLIVNAFTSSDVVCGKKEENNDIEVIKKQIDQYQNLYNRSLQSFADAVVASVEKFLGVKAFFDNAAGGGDKLEKGCEFIVSNCTAAELENVSAEFRNYLETINNTPDEHIWLAVIPAIYCKEVPGKKGKVKKEKLDPLAEIENIDEDYDNESADGLISLNSVKALLEVMKESKIVTFINFKACEATGFKKLSRDLIESWKEQLKSINSRFASFAYPNFTVLPSDKSVVGGVVFPGVYVDASYVAAGITAAWLKPDYLKSLRFRISPEYPSVRFDIERGDNRKRLTTTMNCETGLNTSKEVIDYIAQDCFGFYFGDNPIAYDGQFIRTAYVVNARTLEKNENGDCRNLYRTFVNVFVTLMVKRMDSVVDISTIKKFMEDYAKEWIEKSKWENERFDNSILLENETIEVDEDNAIVVKFGASPERIDVIVKDE